MSKALQTSTPAALEGLIHLLVQQFDSPRTRSAYAHYIRRYCLAGYRELSRDTVRAFIDSMRRRGDSTSAIVTAVASIRHFAREAMERGYLSREEYTLIREIKSPRRKGKREGKWLSARDAIRLWDAPDKLTPQGKRDRVVMGLLFGCGLRREECVRVTWGHYRQLDGRMVLADIIGKGNRVRTIPVPQFVQNDIDAWELYLTRFDKTRIAEDWPIVQAIRSRGRIDFDGENDQRCMDPSRVHQLITSYCELIDLPVVGPHDMRRTLAKLMRKQGVPLEQIQHTLGHSSLVTTEKYLGSGIELEEGKAGTDTIDKLVKVICTPGVGAVPGRRTATDILDAAELAELGDDDDDDDEDEGDEGEDDEN